MIYSEISARATILIIIIKLLPNKRFRRFGRHRGIIILCTPMSSSYPEIHIGQGKQARFIICRATLFAKITYSRDDHCNLGYVFPGVDGGDDGGRHPRESGGPPDRWWKREGPRKGGPRGGIERGVVSERVKECVRAGVSAPERHHHRCYLNVFVGGRRGGGVINVQVEESCTRESANQFVCRRALWFYLARGGREREG